MSDGWIKLHREIIDTEDWRHAPFTRVQMWVDMLLLANHAKGSFRVRGIVVNLDRGQLGWSEESLSKRWKWSRGKVRRFMSELESETVHRIVQQKNFVSSVITILNYDKYQSNDTAEDTANGTTDGQQTDSKRYTNKNDKKKNNGKNEKNNTDSVFISDYLKSFDGFEFAWSEWMAHLSEKKKKPTSRAIGFQLKRLETAKDPIALLSKCIEKNWSSVFVLDTELKENSNEFDSFVNSIVPKDVLIMNDAQKLDFIEDIKRQKREQEALQS